MIGRFGRVLYWGAAGLAVLFLILGTANLALGSDRWVLLYPAAVILFLSGLAGRYVLAGEWGRAVQINANEKA
jgi:FtsH-binding integral membrane protein